MTNQIAITDLTAIDLATEAANAPGAVAYRVLRNDAYAGPVETLVVDSRAGQAINADAVWGDWDAKTQTIKLDGSGLVIGLDGNECE